MGRHALVIGSETRGLEGAVHDARCMAKVLEDQHGFRVDLRFGNDATHDGILDGYNALIGRVGADDAAVLYYAGHGALAVNPDPDDRIRTMQAIIPFDHKPGSPEFRAITAWELSFKLAQLTAETTNVTVILDCCHSAQMSRDAASLQAVPRSLPHPLRMGFREHLAALRKTYPNESLDPLGNPHAVRLVACAQDQSAFEYESTRGDSPRRVGVFTEALIEVLNQVGDASISWSAIGAAVRERVLRRFPAQRPDVAGPSERQPFLLATVDQAGVVPIKTSGKLIQIQSGELLGTSNGDVYAAMPLGATEYDESRAIATLRVEQAAPLFSNVTPVQWMNHHTTLPSDAVAVPIEAAASRRPVAVLASDEERTAIADGLAATRTLQIAETDEKAPLATIRLADGLLTVEDALGPLFPATAYPDDLPTTIKNVANLAVAQRIRELAGPHGLSGGKLETAWGVVDEQGKPHPMPDQGASLGLGDKIYVQVKNTGSGPRYVHIFNVGIDAEVTLLTKNLSLTGYCLNSITPELVIGEQDGELVGLPLLWPDHLPRTVSRTDEIYVIVTTQPANLQQLETRHVILPDATQRAFNGSKMEDLLAQVQDGLPRNIGAPAPIDGFLVKRFAFELHPRVAAMADIRGFQIDENPQHQATGRSADAWITAGSPAAPDAPGAASEAIAIRLGDLVIERNHALFSAGIRVDALVCTRSASQRETYSAHTMQFAGIRDGERLPLDNARLFLGPVRDFVDICLWVSRDTARERSLAELLAQRTASPAFQDAVTALVATAGVTASPWIAAVGASAALARIAYDVILGIENQTIGLYRTSFLTGERFGTGRHPTEGRYRAQDFSFSLLIEPVTPST